MTEAALETLKELMTICFIIKQMASSLSSTRYPVGPTTFTEKNIRSSFRTVASASCAVFNSKPENRGRSQSNDSINRVKEVCSLPLARTTFNKLQAASKAHQTILLPSTTTVAHSKVKLMLGIPTETPINEEKDNLVHLLSETLGICTVAPASCAFLPSKPAECGRSPSKDSIPHEKEVCSLPSATTMFDMQQSTLKSPQTILLPSTTTHNSSNVKLMPDIPSTPIHEAEADLSQPEKQKSKDFDLDIDDPYECVVQQHLDLPQEIVSKISEQTKTKLDFSAILPVHHFRSNSLANVDQTSIKVVLKYPRRNKYLLFDAKKPGTFFLLQGGRNDQLKEAATTASFLARTCYGIFTIYKRKHDICGDTNLVLLPEPVAVINVPEVPTVRTALERYAYHNKRTNFIKLPACWTGDGHEFENLYPSFRDWKSFSKDFSRSMTVQEFNELILGRESPFLLPSELSASQAWKCLQMQARYDWNIGMEGSLLQTQEVLLQSLALDLDYGLVFLSACKISNMTHKIAIQAVENVLSPSLKMSATGYVPNGTNWKFATDTRFLPTIYDKDNAYVLVPTPEHGAEVCKMWFFFEHTSVPASCIDKIKSVFKVVAKSIVDLDESSATDMKFLAKNIIDSDSSSQVTMIRGGILLSVVSFLILSRKEPSLKLIIETYNGKHKGMSVNVTIDACGTPDLALAASKLTTQVIESRSILFAISSMCEQGMVQVDTKQSSLGFGFRMRHNVMDKQDLAYSTLKFKGKNCHEIKYPMGYIPASVCPNLSFGPFRKGFDDENDICDIQRAQSYLEYFSMQKGSNHHHRYSYHKTESNFAKSIDSTGTQDTLNVSVLKQSLPEMLNRLDQSFNCFQHAGGSRIEIAIQPVLNTVQSASVFDFGACILKCWKFLTENTVFCKNQDLAQFGAINSAACAFGYRFALDELSKSTDTILEDVQTQQHVFCFTRYMNTVLETICNGRYIDANPKLFLSNLGCAAGRHLNIVPDIPCTVIRSICEYVQEELPFIEEPASPELTTRQNLIHDRIQANIKRSELNLVITVCYGCGKCFYGGEFLSNLMLLCQYIYSNHHRFARNSDGYAAQAFGQTPKSCEY